MRPVPPGGSNDVHEYLGDAGRAAALDATLSASPKELWRAAVGRGTLGAPAVGERATVVATVDRWVYAIDTRSGAPFWRYRAGTPFAAGPLIAGGSVYAAGEGADGRVVALSLRTGKRRWQTRVGDVGAPMVAADGLLYGATRRGVAFALRQRDGKLQWRRALGGASGPGAEAAGGTLTGPLVVGGRVAIPLVSDSLVVLDARTGRVTSRSALPGGVAAPLSRVDDSTVAAASPAGWVAAVDLADGRVKWLAHTGAPVAGAPVVARDTVYVLTNECTLWAVSARDGSRGDTAAVAPPPGGAWSVPCTTAAGPALVRGGVLVATVGGDVVFYDRAARRSAWSRPARGELRHPPSVRNGQVVVAPVIGNVVSFR